MFHDGFSKRVFGALFRCRACLQNMLFCLVLIGNNICDREFACGERACFVKCDLVDVSHDFKRVSAFYKNAVFACLSDCRHD